MSQAYSALLLSGCLPALFIACDRAAPVAPTQPVSALYECRGEPGYSHIDWDSLRRELKAHPVDCAAPGGDSGLILQPAPATQQADSIRIFVHTVVMDANCHYLTQEEDTTTVAAGTPLRPTLWNARYLDGSQMETGEYYVNTEVRWPEGRKDTTYQKIGFIRTGCGG
ncbi:MAG: hypothetical protein JF616_11590 [Fibrobacteres bacterium]|jgi:hypothetical protein|nr:hypothetical protein [Fibrobacterota bacterium]